MAKEEIQAKYPDFRLTVFDSKSVSYGQGLMAKRAAEMALAGASMEDIVMTLEDYRANMRIYFTVGTLEYLYKGGRLSKTSAVLGGILGIAPVLGIEDGQVVVIAKQRGAKKAWRKMADLVLADKKGTLKECVLGNSGSSEDEDRFKAFMERQLDQKDLDVILPGAAIGAHTGPGLQAIFYIAE
jgi:DegV family protein with EDD domain